VVPSATNDTAVVTGEPLQLQASGAQFYQWFPVMGLNNSSISNPIAILTDSITYIVKVSTAQGCYALDTVHIQVFKTGPDIFVPSAFTPNNDGHNDLFRAIPVGIAHFEYFRIFSRWGQEVFFTSDSSEGWDGTVNGKNAPIGAYVWMAQGIDYLGNRIARKGTVTLIR
jgi:gliding motility-associated-like protein